MQITVDGNREKHNRQRVLVNGEGTFDKIINNIIEVVRAGIAVTLRINVNKENINKISETLDAIPQELRADIAISICNVFQNEKILSTFSLLKEAIEKGYFYTGRKNKYTCCHACFKNAAVIGTDGSVLLCSNTDEEEKRMGYLGKKGNVCIERTADFYKLRTITARDNPECRNCIELPYCIASCKYARLRDNTKCMGRGGDGMTIEERALLDYYYDIQKAKLAFEK